MMGWLFVSPALAAAGGLAGWLFVGLPGCLPWKWAVKIMVGLAMGVFGWLVMGPVYGLFCGFILMVVTDNDRITIEALRPLRIPVSWQDVKAFSAKLARWLIIGLALGLLLGLVLGFVQAEKIMHGPWLTFMSVVMLAIGLVYGLSEGLKAVSASLNETTHPQQRLKDALRSSLLLFPVFVLASTLLFVQGMLSAEWLGIAIGPFLNMKNFYTALFLSAFYSLWSQGTDTVLQHYLLRLCLWEEGQLPLRLVPWLNTMHQRKVFQRVGGSYHFLHKQLQEYLAKQDFQQTASKQQ